MNRQGQKNAWTSCSRRRSAWVQALSRSMMRNTTCSASGRAFFAAALSGSIQGVDRSKPLCNTPSGCCSPGLRRSLPAPRTPARTATARSGEMGRACPSRARDRQMTDARLPGFDQELRQLNEGLVGERALRRRLRTAFLSVSVGRVLFFSSPPNPLKYLTFANACRKGQPRSSDSTRCSRCPTGRERCASAGRRTSRAAW